MYATALCVQLYICAYTLESYVICSTAVTLVGAIFHVGISNALAMAGEKVDEWFTAIIGKRIENFKNIYILRILCLLIDFLILNLI